MSQKFKWIEGRQKNAYSKMLLTESKWPISFDMYFLHFPKGCKVVRHKDPTPHKKHFRLNLVLLKPKKGGIFDCEYSFINTGRVHFFRADAFDHSMSKIEEGECLMFSIGWTTNL